MPQIGVSDFQKVKEREREREREREERKRPPFKFDIEERPLRLGNSFRIYAAQEKCPFKYFLFNFLFKSKKKSI